jgi:hypothetical protein
MHCLTSCGKGCGNYFFGVKIRLLSVRAPDMHGLIGHLPMKASGVCIGIHRDSNYSQTLAGPYNSNSDFTAVGDQDFLKHSIPHKGMFPCLRSGPLAALLSRTCKVRINR